MLINIFSKALPCFIMIQFDSMRSNSTQAQCLIFGIETLHLKNLVIFNYINTTTSNSGIVSFPDIIYENYLFRALTMSR